MIQNSLKINVFPLFQKNFSSNLNNFQLNGVNHEML